MPVRAPVRTWHETGLIYSPAPMRRETRWIVLHWTGSENSARQAFANMRKRSCSVHFICDQLGELYQCADTEARLAHAKPFVRGDVLSGNSYGIGIEIVNAGHGNAPDRGFMRTRRRERVHGKLITYGDFYEAQIASVVALCEALCGAYELPLRVPVRDDGQPFGTVLPRAYLERFRGVLGHYMLDAGKVDPAPALLARIHAAGLALESPPVA